MVFLAHGWMWVGFKSLLALICGGIVPGGVDFGDLVRSCERRSGCVRFVVPDLWQSRGDPWGSRSQRVDSQHVCGDQVARKHVAVC